MSSYSCSFLLFFSSILSLLPIEMAANPFLRPDQLQAKPPPVVVPAPPPPRPIPRNKNLEFRGYYTFEGDWHFAFLINPKTKDIGLKKGESMDGEQATVEDFNLETESIRLSNGLSLKLINSDGKVLSVPSAQPVPKSAPKPVAKSGAKPTQNYKSGFVQPKGSNPNPTRPSGVTLPGTAKMATPPRRIPGPVRNR